MLFLSDKEKDIWNSFARKILESNAIPVGYEDNIRSNLLSAFCYHIGTRFAGAGHYERALEWLSAGTLHEEPGLFSSTFLVGFLSRHQGMMRKTAVAFEDPRPFIHFSHVPVMEQARVNMIHQFTHSLPDYDRPVSCMDIGCGDGALTVRMLSHLVEAGKVPGFKEILLIDPSHAMINLAKEKVGRIFPGTRVLVDNARIQDCSRSLGRHYDIAMSSLAYHHMPVEDKMVHLMLLKPWIDHFLLFEMDANNDTPELNSPELALSVFQSYGRIIDFVYSHDAPVEVVTDCIDSFLMTELVSILTEPRGIRTDYHMLKSQWHDLFRKILAPEFSLRLDSTCYADEYIDLFTLHYGRERENEITSTVRN